MPSPGDFSQDQIKDAIICFLKKNDKPTVKTVRRDASVQLGMEPKALDSRKAEIKELTIKCIQEMEEAASKNEDDESEVTKDNSWNEQTGTEEQTIGTKGDMESNEVKQEKPKSRRKRKSNESNPSKRTRRRKLKKGAKKNDSFVVDEDVEKNTGVEEVMMDDDIPEMNELSESNNEEKSSRKRRNKERSSRKKSKSAVPFDKLAKLKRLARMSGFGNPRLYSLLKPMSKSQAIRHLQNLFDEKNIDYSDLSQSGMSRVAEEMRLKREVAELGNSVITNEGGKRTRRTRKKVNYNLMEMSRIEDQSNFSSESVNEDKGKVFKASSDEDGSEYAPSDD